LGREHDPKIRREGTIFHDSRALKAVSKGSLNAGKGRVVLKGKSEGPDEDQKEQKRKKEMEREKGERISQEIAKIYEQLPRVNGRALSCFGVSSRLKKGSGGRGGEDTGNDGCDI